MKLSKFTAMLFLFVFSMTVMAGQSCPLPDHSGCPDDCPGYMIKRVDDCMQKSKDPDRKGALQKCIDQAKS